MSRYAVVDDNDPAEVSSNKGWGDFSRWVDTLDADNYGQLAHLCAHGWSQQVPLLLKQLRSALDSEEPDDDVAAVGKNILDAVSGGDVVSITDGMSKGES